MPSVERIGEWKQPQPGRRLWIPAKISSSNPWTSCKQIKCLRAASFRRKANIRDLSPGSLIAKPLAFQLTVLKAESPKILNGNGEVRLGPRLPSTLIQDLLESGFNSLLIEPDVDAFGVLPKECGRFGPCNIDLDDWAPVHKNDAF